MRPSGPARPAPRTRPDEVAGGAALIRGTMPACPLIQAVRTVIPSNLESEEILRAILVAAALTLSTAVSQAAQTINAFSGAVVPFGIIYALQPNCRPVPGQFVVVVVRHPLHGKIFWSNAIVPIEFPKGDPERVCNGTARHGLRFYYRADAGYVGSDDFGVQVTGPLGRTFSYLRQAVVQAGR
jgi:hypothetical protein